MKGISRIDSYKAVGWYVRIYYEDHTLSKFFSDGKYGGKAEALQKAVEYRDEQMRLNPPPEKLPFRVKPIKRNTSGVSGISETYTRQRRTREKTPCFNVFWAPQPNERKMTRVYHHHYETREEAFEAAVKIRREKEREILEMHRQGKRRKSKI